MNESTDQIPPDAESIRRNQIDMDFFKGTILPVIERHGMDRGGRILTHVGDVMTRMHAWPDDIKESCMEELLRIMAMAKQKASSQQS